MPDPAQLADMFKALSVESRVRIVQLLRERVLCVGALAHRLGITQAAVSQHLRILRNVGLVTANKNSNFVHYSLNTATFDQWRGLIESFLGNGKD